MRTKRGSAGKRWFYFKEGCDINEAGLRILKVIQRKKTQDATIYYIEKKCCGHRENMSHIEILRRIFHRKDTLKKDPDRPHGCWKCSPRHSSKSRNSPELSRHMEEIIVMPTWPILSTLRGKDPGIWEDGSYPT